MPEFGAGAKYRKTLPPEKRGEAVMKSFGKGELHSGSGEIVKDPKQAYAIAKSEERVNKFNQDISECMRKLYKADPDKSQEQRAAICYNKARKGNSFEANMNACWSKLGMRH